MCDRDGLPFSRENLKRLLRLETIIEKLTIGSLDGEVALLPLSAQVGSLSYTLDAANIEPEECRNLDIVATDLDLTIDLEGADDWDGLLISICNRFAELGHLERLSFSIEHSSVLYDWLAVDRLARVAEALARAIQANPKLAYLHLNKSTWSFDWGSHLQVLFKAMEEHAGIRIFVTKYSSLDDRDYGWLKQLLTRNRNITVMNVWDKKITNGTTIDQLYALNGFSNGSAKLEKEESPELRSLLVAATMVESASENMPYTALLLADHTDSLCGEFIDGIIMNRNNDQDNTAESVTEETPDGLKKRKMTIQTPLAGTKAARTESEDEIVRPFSSLLRSQGYSFL